MYREVRFINTVFSDTATAEAFLRNPSPHQDEVAVFGTLVENDQLLDESGNGNHADVSSISLSDGRKTTGIPPVRYAFNCSSEQLNGVINSIGDVLSTGSFCFLVSLKITNTIDGNGDLIFIGNNRLYIPAFDNSIRARINENIATGIVFSEGQAYEYIVNIFLFRDSINNRVYSIINSDNDIRTDYLNSNHQDLTGLDLHIQTTTINNVQLMRIGCWSRLLNTMEIASMYNNSWLKNPSYETLNGLEGYFLFNGSDTFIEGANLMLRDHSGNNRHAIINGLTGVDAPEKLITFRNQLVAIDTLRDTQPPSLLTEESSVLTQEDGDLILL